MIKILIGGSPCTYWSIAQKNGRETEASGMGWELFKNYLIANDKFKPDFFLYENNKSAAQAIKDQISTELGVPLMHINSSLVSAQNRQRFYAFNWEVEQPEDRGILLRDVLEPSALEVNYALDSVSSTGGSVDEPVRVGTIENNLKNKEHASKQYRVYSVDGKSTTLCGQGGGVGAKTGLYLVPATGKETIVYEVINNTIALKGKRYPINLPDGYYVIRQLTPVECERLQTLPDGYTKAVSDSQRRRGLGNGWTAEVIIHILNGVLKDVPRDEEIVVLSMYDGIGTGRYCLDKMGFTNVKYFASEIDKYAKQVALSNYPDIIQLGDAFDVRHPDWTVGY